MQVTGEYPQYPRAAESAASSIMDPMSDPLLEAGFRPAVRQLQCCGTESPLVEGGVSVEVAAVASVLAAEGLSLA